MVPWYLELPSVSQQSHHAEFNQTLCHILLKICKQPVLLQHMVSCGLIRGLSNLLQYRGSQTRELDSATIQLFEMAVQAGQVYEELIHEGVISLLFDIIKRDIDSSEICETACRILAAIGGFAKRCRLDISPFLTSQHCQATTLVIAAENHSAIASLTLSVLAIFVNLAWNAIRVQQLINSKCVEGLLSWYITANSPDLRTDFGEGIVEVVSCCSRAVIDAFAMETEMTTLPALFLCLRSYSDNAKFVSNVFAIVTKQWRAKVTTVVRLPRAGRCTNDNVSIGMQRALHDGLRGDWCRQASPGARNKPDVDVRGTYLPTVPLT